MIFPPTSIHFWSLLNVSDTTNNIKFVNRKIHYFNSKFLFAYIDFMHYVAASYAFPFKIYYYTPLFSPQPSQQKIERKKKKVVC